MIDLYTAAVQRGVKVPTDLRALRKGDGAKKMVERARTIVQR